MKKIFRYFLCLIALTLTSCQDNSSQPFSTSDQQQQDPYTSIKEIIDLGEGFYQTKGVITKKQIGTSSLRLWIQNTYQNQDEAILLNRVFPEYDTLNVGDSISVNGYYQLYQSIPTIFSPSIEKIEDLTINTRPVELSNYAWNQLDIYDINRLVAVKDLSFTFIDKDIKTVDEMIQATATYNNLTLSINIDCYNLNQTNHVAQILRNTMENHLKVDVIGVVSVTADQKYCLNILDEEDITINYQTNPQSRKINLYGINDFHGAVIENGYEAGIVKVGSYLKEKKSNGNTLLINSGDFWQGAIESNYNRGNLLTDCMNQIEFDCFTLGNHEFDWGNTYIQQNRERKSKINYQTPFLAANIYQYDISSKTEGEYANLGEKYTIRTLENGLKVGIIGVIGKDQITSITSSHVDNLIFKDPTPIIKDLSDELKTQKEVDVVILSCHTDQRSITQSNFEGSDSSGITLKSPVSNEKYVDAVFCAHTHQNEVDYINGVPFVQTNGSGKAIANIELEVNANGSISCNNYAYQYTSSINTFTKDKELEEIVNQYKSISDNVGSEVLTSISNNLDRYSTLTNLVTTAMADYATKNKIQIDYAIANSGRADLNYGQVTYANLYKALPFDNEIYIIQTSGSAIKNELRYSSNAMYRFNSKAIVDSQIYTIAVLDYLALHRNVNREYDYFPGMKIIDKYTKSGYDIYHYRDLTADFMREFKNKTMDVEQFSNSNNRHNKNLLTQNVNFA